MRKTHWYGGALVLILASFLAFTSCEKPIAAVDEVGEISFAFNIPGTKKDASPQDGKTPECVDATADYVTVKLLLPDGVTMKWYTLDLLALGDGTVTEALKLPAGDYKELEFYVFSDEDGDMDGYYPADAPQGLYPAPDGMDGDDLVVYASPYENSYYDILFNFTFNVTQEFTLLPFEKQENYIDVLCYRPAYYKDFGFKHWDYHPFEVREKCFYGDICTKFWEDFRDYVPEKGTNPYYGWPQHYDMYGIFEIQVKNPDRVDEAGNIIPGAITTATNLDWDFNDPKSMGPVCVEYLDDLEVDGEQYGFTLWIYWPDGSKTLEHRGRFTDATPNPFGWLTDPKTGVIIGGDGVWTWQVGDCGHPSNDIELILPALLYLPENGTIDILSAGHAGTAFDYFDVKLIGPSWNNPLYPDEIVENNILPGWCGDLFTGISAGTYEVDVYSSLKPWTMPNTPSPGAPGTDPLRPVMQDYPWDVLNWLANNNDLIVADVDDGKELQAIIWTIIHGTGPNTVSAIEGQAGYGAGYIAAKNTHAEAAFALNAGAGFTPRTGDWSVVALNPYRDDNSKDKEWYQLVLVRVDP